MAAGAWLASVRVLGLCLAPALASAQSVALSGILGSKALLVIDGGAPRSLAAGEGLGAVRVLQVGRDEALIDIAGRQQRLRMGEAPVQLGARLPADGAPQRLVLSKPWSCPSPCLLCCWATAFWPNCR